MLAILFVGAVCLSSCGDDDEGGISNNGGLKGYYIANKTSHLYGYSGDCHTIVYFQGDGKGVIYDAAMVSNVYDEWVEVVKAEGKTYCVQSWRIKPMVYEIIGGNTISVIATDGTTMALNISDGQITGYRKLK